MPHKAELIATIAVGLTAAFLFALVAPRLPPIVGYLLAGVAVGPFAPGFVAETDLAPQLAEIGVILLIFSLGIHISPGEFLFHTVSTVQSRGATHPPGTAPAIVVEPSTVRHD